jgi:hypothetical protein
MKVMDEHEREKTMRDIVNAFLGRVHRSRHTICPDVIPLLEEALREVEYTVKRKKLTRWEMLGLMHDFPQSCGIDPDSEEFAEFVQWYVKLRKTRFKKKR